MGEVGRFGIMVVVVKVVVVVEMVEVVVVVAQVKVWRDDGVVVLTVAPSSWAAPNQKRKPEQAPSRQPRWSKVVAKTALLLPPWLVVLLSLLYTWAGLQSTSIPVSVLYLCCIKLASNPTIPTPSRRPTQFQFCSIS